MTSSKQPGRTRSPQHGAALVTSMLLLLIVTILGISAMQMSRMQERMAGNTRDRSLGLQGAEGALRAAERLIASQNSLPICPTEPCEIWPRGRLIADVAQEDAEWWNANAQTFGTPAKEMDRLDEDPEFIIEEYIAPRIDGVALGEPEERRDFYVITARSTGGTGQSTVVLQTTYARRY